MKYPRNARTFVAGTLSTGDQSIDRGLDTLDKRQIMRCCAFLTPLAVARHVVPAGADSRSGKSRYTSAAFALD